MMETVLQPQIIGKYHKIYKATVLQQQQVPGTTRSWLLTKGNSQGELTPLLSAWGPFTGHGADGWKPERALWSL